MRVWNERQTCPERRLSFNLPRTVRPFANQMSLNIRDGIGEHMCIAMLAEQAETTSTMRPRD
jgi:hypothetical protein